MRTLSSVNTIDCLKQLDGIFKAFPEKALTVCEGKENTKNISFLISIPDGQDLLVKQERPTFLGDFPNDLLNEWYLHEFLQTSATGTSLSPYIRSMTGYLPSSLVGVYEYLSDYEEFYSHILQQTSVFPTQIASLIGKVLGTIHTATLDHSETRQALTQERSFWQTKGSVFSLLNHRITPEMLGSVPPDYLRFIKLYQRYESLEQAMEEARRRWHPCCLVHNDLNVANILVHKDWRSRIELEHELEDIEPAKVIKIIDWERSSWGDPLMDVGYLVSNYLMLWLTSMVIDPQMDLNATLKSATISLDDVRPSIVALLKTYLQSFPESLTLWPSWPEKLMQFIALGLLIQAQARIEYSAVLSNSDIYALQVAKGLLCRPSESFPTVFGFDPQMFSKPLP
jgi:hypothetical protein